MHITWWFVEFGQNMDLHFPDIEVDKSERHILSIFLKGVIFCLLNITNLGVCAIFCDQ